jgi:hypothetical protein
LVVNLVVWSAERLADLKVEPKAARRAAWSAVCLAESWAEWMVALMAARRAG